VEDTTIAHPRVCLATSIAAECCNAAQKGAPTDHLPDPQRSSIHF
jgi:hypothetical protein